MELSADFVSGTPLTDPQHPQGYALRREYRGERPRKVELRPMLADAIRLLLFPALMAFAASSDLITMTISNRVSLALAASFFALALMWHMPLAEIGLHAAASATVLVVAFVFFARGWIGG